MHVANRMDKNITRCTSRSYGARSSSPQELAKAHPKGSFRLTPRDRSGSPQGIAQAHPKGSLRLAPRARSSSPQGLTQPQSSSHQQASKFNHSSSAFTSSDSLSYTLMSSKVFTTILLKREVLQNGEHLGHTIALHLLPLHQMGPGCKQGAVVGSWVGGGQAA